MTKSKKNEKKWKPKYCLACHKLIKPGEKRASYTTVRRSVYYFHEEHYKKLLGKKRGGRPTLGKIDLLITKAEQKREEYLRKKSWNEEDFEKFNGMKRILPGLPKADVTELKIKPTNRPPKAHVITESQPKGYTKEEHLEMIIELLQDGIARTSKQIAADLLISRSTITWRLWDHCQGNDKSDLEEIFYIAKRIKGEQYYSLIDLRIKEVKSEDKQALGTIQITVKYCKLCGGVMTSVAPNSQVLMCPDGHTEVRK